MFYESFHVRKSTAIAEEKIRRLTSLDVPGSIFHWKFILLFSVKSVVFNLSGCCEYE